MKELSELFLPMSSFTHGSANTKSYTVLSYGKKNSLFAISLGSNVTDFKIAPSANMNMRLTTTFLKPLISSVENFLPPDG